MPHPAIETRGLTRRFGPSTAVDQVSLTVPARTGATVLLSSHLLGEIEQVATHVGILAEGRLVLEGELAQLKSALGTEVVIGTDEPERARDIAAAEGFAAECRDDALVARLPTGEATRDSTAALNRALCFAGVRVHALALRERSLETLYHHAAQPAALA